MIFAVTVTDHIENKLLNKDDKRSPNDEKF